ncbi:MAG: hypothetical protein COA78_15410 [Blastopirellula sp.]|nr:MAG: hypothetical protein COA78_15410 [Blastopirellula sp.]
MPEDQPDSSAPSSSSPEPTGGAQNIGYWKANLRLIIILLSIWAFVSFGCSVLWIEWLNKFKIGTLPLGFWIAQQGAIYVFVILIFVYALAMDHYDRKFNVKE